VFLTDKFSPQEDVSSPVESHHCRSSIDSLFHHPRQMEYTIKLKAFAIYTNRW